MSDSVDPSQVSVSDNNQQPHEGEWKEVKDKYGNVYLVQSKITRRGSIHEKIPMFQQAAEKNKKPAQMKNKGSTISRIHIDNNSDIKNLEQDPAAQSKPLEVAAPKKSEDGPKQEDIAIPSTAEEILSFMSTHADNIDVLHRCLMALIQQVQDPSKKQLVAQKGFDSLSTTFKAHGDSLEIALPSCRIFWQLALQNEEGQRKIMGGGLDLVLQAMMSHHSSNALQEEAITLIRILSSSERNRPSIIEKGYPELLETMRKCSAVPQIQEKASAALRALARNSDNQVKMMAEGFPLLLAAMKNHPGVATLQEQACAAVHNLSCHTDNQARILAEAYPQVLSAMKEHINHLGFLERALAFVWNLSYTNDDYRAKIMEAGYQLVLDVMHKHENNADIQRNGSGALRNLAVHDAYREQMRHGAVDALSNALKKHGDNPHVQEEASCALKNLGIGNEEKPAEVETAPAGAPKQDAKAPSGCCTIL